MNWYALSYKGLKNGDLEIKTSGKVGRQAMLEEYGESLDSDDAMYGIFEYLTCNGLNWVSPEAVGALTSAPILSDTPESDLRVESKIWWFPNYAVESPVRTLFQTGKVVFARGK